jgi:hypothetical protein
VIHTSVITDGSGFDIPFSSIADVNTQVIIPDLEFAAENLPQEWTLTENTGRATWGAAKALLGKVYLYNQDWTTAANLFKEVIDSRIYGLTPDIMDNFTDQNEFNEESIFETNYSDVLKPGAPGASIDDNEFETSGEATNLSIQMAHLSAGGFNTVISSYYLHELMVYDTPDPSLPANNGFTFSKRMNASLAPENYEGLYYQKEQGTIGGWGFGQTAYVKKFSNWYQKSQEDAQGRSGINWRHIRLADVYLMYAEAILEANGDAAVAEAMEYIDLIRARAGVMTLQSYMDANGGTFPALQKSLQVHGGTHDLVAPSAANVLTHIKRVERPLELCFEGHRWRDLVRWGMVSEVLTEMRADEEWRLANFNDLVDQPPLHIVERIRPDYAVSSQTYTPEAHDYYPIPTSEKQINSAID